MARPPGPDKLSVSMDLPVLPTSQTWNHTLRGGLCAGLLTRHVFSVHSRYGRGQCLIPFTFCLHVHQPMNVLAVSQWETSQGQKSDIYNTRCQACGGKIHTTHTGKQRPAPPRNSQITS